MKDRVLLLSALLALWLLRGFPLAHSHCTPEKCDDENVKSLLDFSRTTANISSPFRLRSLDASPTEDGKSIFELHCQDESKTIIGFYIQACSDDGKGQFDATFENMNIQHTSCQAPLDTVVLLPASLENPKQYWSIQLTWVAPWQQNSITVIYSVLDNFFERHGPIQENLTIELSSKNKLKPRIKRVSTISDALVLANVNFIQQISLDGRRVKTLLSGLQGAIAVDFHYRWGYLFWTDTIEGSISRANLDGSMRAILLEGLGHPGLYNYIDGLAVDWVTDKLYWSDAGLAQIGVFDLTTNLSRILISTGTLSSPRALVVDPNTRMMYWTDIGSNAAIERASMDGRNRTVIHNTSLVLPNALTLDYSTQKLYWLDAVLNILQSSNVDGTDRITLLTTGIVYPLSITTSRGSLYWTDFFSRSINAFNSSGSGNITTIFNRTCNTLVSIQVISEARQQDPDSNPCVNNGGCSHFCLLSSVTTQGYSCSCPEGMVLDGSSLNCTLPSGNTVANVLLEGSCVAAGYTACCTSGSCEGTVDTCYCDANCHMFGDCCTDVPVDCQSAPNRAYFILANRLFNHKMSLDGRRIRTVASDLDRASRIDYDISGNRYYWTDTSQRKIWRAQLDGTQAVAIVDSNLEAPADLSVDWASNKLYWTDFGAQSIDVFDLTSGYRANIIQTGSGSNPRAIVLDPQNRLMYWTIWGNISRIEKASMDGANRVEIINTGLVLPITLTLDYQEQVLYWGNRYYGTIESSNVDGTNRRMIASGVPNIFSITVFADKLYFTTEFLYTNFLTTNKSGGANVETLSLPPLCERVLGIEVVAASCQVNVSTLCAISNGGCSHLCLLSSVAPSGHSCACPDGMVLNSDQMTCNTVVPPTQPQVAGSSAVMEQDTLWLHCTSSGYPLPMITWVKRIGEEASILVNSLRVSIAAEYFDSNSTTASTLQIHHAMPVDQAYYQCEASNEAGTSATAQAVQIIERDRCEPQPCQNGGTCVRLVGNYFCNCSATFTGRNCTEPIINDTPQVPTVVNPPIDTTAEIVHPVNLTCEAEGYPAPSYEWYLDGVLIPGEMLSYLYIPEAQPSDRGNYTCKAINYNGEIESPPALVNISGVYQYLVTVEPLAEASSEDILEEAIQISASFANTTVVMIYSVEILRSTSSENVSLLFTMVEEETTQTFSRQVLETQLQAFSTAQIISITRYDGCDADGKDGYSWPETNVAIAVIMPCPCEELLHSLAGKAVRYCSGTYTAVASWNEIDYRDCAVNSSTTTSTLCNLAGTAEEVAQEVTDITESAELVASDIAATVSILEVFNITDQAASNPEVQNNYLQIVDNVQQANASAVLESQMETRSSSRLLNSIGTFLDNVETSNETNTTTLAFQTYALQAQDIDPSSFQGQIFNVDLGSVEEAMKTNGEIDEARITTSAMVMEAITNATAAVQVPQSLFSNNSSSDNNSSNQRLSHTVFLTDVLFQTEDPNTTIGSIIVGVLLNNTLSLNLSTNLTIFFQTSEKLAQNKSDSSCAAWDSDEFGAWSTSSCTESTDSNNGQRVCSCRQLGHFGILFDLSPRAQDPAIALTLSVITYILLVASLVCLTILILTFAASKKLRTSIHGQILINLSAALMGLYIMFAIGGSAVSIPAMCGISSALLHYFILVFFGWTAVEAVWLYLKIVKVLGIQKYEESYILKAALPTWLVPLLIVIISGGAGHKYYANPFYCRPTQWPFFFGLILPFITVYVFNWVIYVMIMTSFCRHLKRRPKGGKSSKTQKEIYVQNFVVAVTLAVVLGLGWGLGLLATSHDVRALTTVFQVLFALFVGLQGVLIFLLHGVRNPDAREVWKSIIRYAKRSKKHAITTPTASSQADNQPSVTSSDIGLTTLTRTTLPRKSDIELEASSVSQKETCVEENIELASHQDITKTDTETLPQREVSSNTDFAVDPVVLSQMVQGRRRSLPQLDHKRISQRAFSYTDLEVYWSPDGLQKAESFSEI